jgi:hypothetical protein
MFAEKFRGEPQVMEPDEIVEWRWFSLENLPTPLFPPSAKIVENLRNNLFYIELN